MDKIKLSVIIVNYRSEKYLDECLSSIEKSDFPNDILETIVVSNSPLNKELKIIENRYPQVIYIHNHENAGFSVANNSGIRKSSGQYILILNPDTIIHKSTLSYMVDYLEHHYDIGIATCLVKLSDGAIDDACHRGFPTPWNAFCYFSGMAGIFPTSSFFNGYHLGYKNLDKVHEIDSCAGAFLMIKRTAGEKVKWFDEDYFWYGEDIDLCFRVKEAGFKVLFIPQVAIMHHKGVTSGIKKHSKNISSSTKDVRKKATVARFDVMSLFYRKHYLQKYPKLITQIVLCGINIKKFITLQSLK